VGKIPTQVAELGVDLLSVAGTKSTRQRALALFHPTGVQLEALMHGAGHESGRRAGTENVLLDVALGTACELAATDLESRRTRLTELRDYFHSALKSMFGDTLHLNDIPWNACRTRSTSALPDASAVKYSRPWTGWRRPPVQPVTADGMNFAGVAAMGVREVIGLAQCVSVSDAGRRRRTRPRAGTVPLARSLAQGIMSGSVNITGGVVGPLLLAASPDRIEA